MTITRGIYSLRYLVFLSLFLSWNAVSSSSSTVALDGNTGFVNLSSVVDYFIPAEGKNFSHNDWKPLDKLEINFAYSDNEIWLRFSVINTHDKQSTYLLVNDWSGSRYIAEYFESATTLPELNQLVELPSEELFGVRSIELVMAPQEMKNIFVKIKTDSLIHLPLRIYSKEYFSDYNSEKMIWISLFIGVIAALALYNLVLGIQTGDSIYLLYCLFQASLAIFEIVRTGFGHYFIWGGWGDQAFTAEAEWFAFSLFAAISYTSGLLFFLRLVDMPKIQPLLDSIGRWLAVVPIISVVLLIVLPEKWFMLVAFPFATLIVVYLLFISFYAHLRGNVLATYYLIAWSIMLLSTLALSLWMFGLVAHTTLYEYGQIFGAAFEAVALSLALALRIKLQEARLINAVQEVSEERKLRIDAQIEVLKTEQKAKQELEAKVLERTQALETLTEQLIELSDTDQLTGMKNRRYLDRVLREEMGRCERHKHQISVLLMDVDHFKKFNDNYGHIQGDECLKKVSQVIKLSGRKSGDFSARYGGEEFCVVLPETGQDGAGVIAERIRSRIESIELYIEKEKVPITISIGLVTLIPNNTNSDQLLEFADEALYAAKSKGRNCVSTHPKLAFHSAFSENSAHRV